jgi:peroxin-16
VKLRKWQLVDKFGLMISESNTYVEIDHKEEEAAE